MKHLLALLSLALICVVMIMLGLDWFAYTEESQAGPGITIDEAWCEAMLDTPNDQWSETSTVTFGQYCLNP